MLGTNKARNHTKKKQENNQVRTKESKQTNCRIFCKQVSRKTSKKKDSKQINGKNARN